MSKSESVGGYGHRQQNRPAVSPSETGDARPSAWRNALFGSAATGAMILAMGAPAWGVCVATGATLECSGENSIHATGADADGITAQSLDYGNQNIGKSRSTIPAM